MEDCFYRANNEGVMVWASPSTFRLLGLNPDAEMAEVSVTKFYARPEDRKKLLETLKKTGRVTDYEVELRGVDGRKIMVSTNSTYWRDEDGEVLGVEGIFRDITARRRIEEALRESEGKYRSVIEQSSDNIYLADVETGKILEANPALRKTLGYSADELMQMTVFDFIDHDEEDVRDKIERAAAGELSYLSERKYRRRDGSRLDVEVSVGKMMFRGKETLCVISRDITERRRAQQALQENEAKYRTLVESAGEAIFTMTRDGDYLFVNSIGANRLGLTPEELIGKNMRDLFPPAIAERQLETVQRVLDSGEGETVESVTSIRGSERRYRTSIQPIRDNTGRMVAAMGIARDTTEIALTRAELEQERDFVRSLLDTANSLIVCLDSEAKITVFNRECERLTGYSREEVLGRSWPELFLPPEVRHEGLKDFGHWVHEHLEDMYEGPLVTKSGEIRTILWSNSTLFTSSPDGLTAIAVGQDITERKRAQEALQDSERRYALATAAAKVGVWDYNIETGEFYIDPAIMLSLGYREHEKVRNRSQWLQLIYEGDRQAAVEAARAHMAGETPEFVHEHRFVAKDGSLRWMLARGHVIHGRDGRPIRMVGTDTDITERKRAEEDLTEAEERFRELVQTMSDGLGVIDEHDVVRYVNDRFCEMLGYSREELLGSIATELLEPTHREAAERQFGRRSRGEREAYETVMIRSDGRRLNVIVSPAPLLDQDDQFRGSVAVFTDITERMQAEHLLRLQRDFGIALSLARDLHEVLEKLLDVCLEVEGVDCGGVYILDESTGCLQLATYRNLSSRFVDQVKQYDPGSMQMKLVLEGKPVYSLCSETPFNNISLFNEEGLKSLAIIPVLFEHQVLAVLNLASHSWTHIPSGIRNSLESFAGRIGGIITRLRTESALRESESRFRELADLLPQTVYEVDANLNITFVNRQGVQMFGFTPELLETGINGLDVFAPEDRKRLMENVRRAFEGENLGGIDYTAMRMDGTTFPVIVYADPVVRDGKVQGLRGIVIDVTERKQAEEAIKQGEERARAQFKSIPVPTYTWRWEGDDFMLTDYNHKAVEITNGTIRDLVGMKFKDMYPHWPEGLEDMMKSLQERTVIKREMVYRFQTTGMDRILDVSYAYVPPNMVTVHTVDITERKEAVERLKYRVKLEELVATISTKFINLFSDEIDGGIEYALKSLAEFAGVDRSCVCQFFDDQSAMTTTHEWCSNRVGSLPNERRTIPTASIPWMMSRIRRGNVFVVPRVSGLPVEAEGEKNLLSSRGIVSMIMVPMTYAGRLIGVLSLDSIDADRSWREEDVLLVRMVSEILVSALQRKRTEQELDRANKEKVAQAKQMAGGFAHEIRNALFPARGSVDRLNQMLSKPNPKLASLRKYPQIADKSVSRALDITALISRYTKLDSERFPERVNIKEVIDEVLANNQLLLKERGVKVSVSGIADSTVESNRSQFYMVINNLLINSLDAMEETAAPAITITVESASAGVRLLFTDNGCGISSEEIDRVFEAFYSTKPDRGTGIGLATAKKIMEMYGGAIRVRSEAGKGTTFELVLRYPGEATESN
jgi:PAS domain S-box-containing protein